MKKISLLIIAVFIVLIAIASYLYSRQHVNNPASSSSTVPVVASFYPLAEFARQVGGNLVTITTVVPAGSEPHEYEPTPQELSHIYKSRLFIYNGNGLDPWAEKVADDVQKQGVKVIKMSAQLPVDTTDPHFWLDPVLAQKEVEVIRDAVLSVDPSHATTYQAQADKYLSQLKQLDQNYRHDLATCTNREIVTSHAAFGYLAKRYNLTVINIAGLSPEEEPSAQQLSQIAQLARQKNIQYIFFETLVSPKLADTIAQEIGAKTLVFNPLEGLTNAEIQAGKNYISVMQDNLQNVRLALDCQ